jgi:hypothetical protein
MDSINRRRLGCKEKELIFGTWNVRTLFKNGRRKEPKEGSKTETSIPQDQWEDQEPNGQMFRGMHYGCWGRRRRAENRD